MGVYDSRFLQLRIIYDWVLKVILMIYLRGELLALHVLLIGAIRRIRKIRRMHNLCRLMC
jgi:hypothetical protein